MTTTEQMQQMIDLLQQQMKVVTDLQAENARLREASVVETNTADNGTGRTSPHVNQYRSKRPERPTISANIDDREWAIFADHWARYKRMCKLEDTDVENIRLELRACCTSDVNKHLFEYVGRTKLDACDETQLLAHIKSVAVKVVHKEVHRMAFNSLFQDQGEPVTQWVARVQAKAFLCEFEIPCTCCTPPQNQSYAEEEVAQRLIAGLCNQEHQRRILSEAATLTTLEQKVKRLQVLETTEQSAQSLHRPQPQPPSEAAVGTSQYKSAKRPPKVPLATNISAQKCRWCGLSSHPGGKPLERKTCPAFKKVCNKCQKTGHFSRVCENSEAATADVEEVNMDLPPLPSDASVSFSFGTETRDEEQDFRITRNINGEP